ncbi:MAG: hypothetical protein IKW02_02835 [Clostridia bacterium]|nr:hypothetical protein [Clostridia bacterium]
MPLFDIAGLTVEVVGEENEFFNKRFAAYKSVKEQAPHLKVEFTGEGFMPSGQPIATVEGFRQCFHSAEEYGIFDLLKAPDIYCAGLTFDSDVKNAKAFLTDISMYGGMSNEIRAFNMLGELFRYFMLKNNGVVLHSSCIKYKNSGIAFSAPSGTGKSTHTGLWKKYFPEDVTVLNDDSPAIRLDGFVPGLYGTPWSGKTDINAQDSAPLEAIVILQQHPENEITRLSSDEAVFRVLQEVARPVFPEFIELVLSAVEKLIVQVPVYLLKCNISEQAVLTVKNELGL